MSLASFSKRGRELIDNMAPDLDSGFGIRLDEGLADGRMSARASLRF